jgi:hypothetical protein
MLKNLIDMIDSSAGGVDTDISSQIRIFYTDINRAVEQDKKIELLSNLFERVCIYTVRKQLKLPDALPPLLSENIYRGFSKENIYKALDIAKAKVKCHTLIYACLLILESYIIVKLSSES